MAAELTREIPPQRPISNGGSGLDRDDLSAVSNARNLSGETNDEAGDFGLSLELDAQDLAREGEADLVAGR
jgi:hypothetical protein